MVQQIFFFLKPKVLLNLTESMWVKIRSHSMGVMSFRGSLRNQYFIFSRTPPMTRTIKVDFLEKSNIQIQSSKANSADFQKEFLILQHTSCWCSAVCWMSHRRGVKSTFVKDSSRGLALSVSRYKTVPRLHRPCKGGCWSSYSISHVFRK